MRIAFEGDCTMARAEETKSMLLEALQSGQPLELDFLDVTRIDLAFCQILHALKLSCRDRGIPCSILPGALPEVAAIGARCGLLEFQEASAS